MSPADVRACSVAARSIWMSPYRLSIRTTPSRPSQSTSAAVSAACRSEPTGASSSTSTDGMVPMNSSRGRRGEVTTSRPSAYSTRVWSAAWTSAAFRSLVGRTVTTVSARSLARTRSEPPETSMRIWMGEGVSNVGMAWSSGVEGAGGYRTQPE